MQEFWQKNVFFCCYGTKNKEQGLRNGKFFPADDRSAWKMENGKLGRRNKNRCRM